MGQDIDSGQLERFVKLLKEKGFDHFRFKGCCNRADLLESLVYYFEARERGANQQPVFPLTISSVTMATSPDMPLNRIKFSVIPDQQVGLKVNQILIERVLCHDGAIAFSHVLPMRSAQAIPSKNEVNALIDRGIKQRKKGIKF